MFFSVVTITKNHLAGLQRTYASLGKQTCGDYEWIVIDGNSSDGSINFLNKLNLNFISEPDTGIYDAMNKGIKSATGDYILFLNAGDELADHHVLEEVKNEFLTLNTAPAFIYGDALEFSSKQLKTLKPARGLNTISYGMFTHHQSMLYRRTDLQMLEFNTDYKIASDYDLTLRFIKRFIHSPSDTLYINRPFCLFETGGISQREASQGRKEQFLIRKKTAMPYLKNASIYYLQSVSIAIKQIFPELYWWVRKKI